MKILWWSVLAQAIAATLSSPSGAAPRGAGHVAEAPREAAPEDGDDATIDIDAPEPAPIRPHTAAADDPAWHAGIAVGTDIPVDALNVGAVIQAPFGLRLSSSVGFLTNVFLGRMDAPDGGHAATVLMHAALSDTIVWRTHLGIRPWKAHGFYASAGYGMCTLGGAITTGDAMSAVLGRMLPSGLGAVPLVHVASTLHTLDLEAGWEWSIAHRFKFRTAIGAAMIVASTTSLHVDDGSLASLPLVPVGKLVAPLERSGEAAIDGLYKEVGPIVMLTMQLQFDLL